MQSCKSCKICCIFIMPGESTIFWHLKDQKYFSYDAIIGCLSFSDFYTSYKYLGFASIST